MRRLDRTDARILLGLDAAPQGTTLALARALGLARNTVHARRRRLEGDGVLGPPSRRVDPRAAGYPILAFVSLEISQGDLDRTVEGLAAIPEILELHAMTGDGDLLARVVARSPEDLHRITRLMLTSPSVARTRTALAVRELIAHRTAPLLARLADEDDGEAAGRVD